MITNHREKDHLARSMTKEEEGVAEHIYISADLDWLPPRPRFIPCLPESFCFSFGDPFINCRHCCSSVMQNVLYQNDDCKDSHNNMADVRKYILPSSSSPGQASMEKEQDNSPLPISPSSSFLLDEESPAHQTSRLGIFPVRSVTLSHGQGHHHSHNLLDDVPTLSCIDEDDTEVSEEGSCPDIVGQGRQGQNHTATALQPHHHLLPPGAEFLFRFCQFLFSILVVDQMNKLNMHGKKRRSSTPPPINASPSLSIKE
jgi:hypothetical protein